MEGHVEFHFFDGWIFFCHQNHTNIVDNCQYLIAKNKKFREEWPFNRVILPDVRWGIMDLWCFLMFLYVFLTPCLPVKWIFLLTLRRNHADLYFFQRFDYFSFERSSVCKFLNSLWGFMKYFCIPPSRSLDIILQDILLRQTASYIKAFFSKLGNSIFVLFGMSVAHSQQINNI